MTTRRGVHASDVPWSVRVAGLSHADAMSRLKSPSGGHLSRRSPVPTSSSPPGLFLQESLQRRGRGTAHGQSAWLAARLSSVPISLPIEYRRLLRVRRPFGRGTGVFPCGRPSALAACGKLGVLKPAARDSLAVAAVARIQRGLELNSIDGGIRRARPIFPDTLLIRVVGPCLNLLRDLSCRCKIPTSLSDFWAHHACHRKGSSHYPKTHPRSGRCRAWQRGVIQLGRQQDRDHTSWNRREG